MFLCYGYTIIRERIYAFADDPKHVGAVLM